MIKTAYIPCPHGHEMQVTYEVTLYPVDPRERKYAPWPVVLDLIHLEECCDPGPKYVQDALLDHLADEPTPEPSDYTYAGGEVV